MEIDHCYFADDVLYDLENNTWTRTEGDTVVVGINSLLTAIAGKLIAVRLKSRGIAVVKGRSLGTLESLRFVGPVPSPISGMVLASNDEVVRRPKLVNDSPYVEGWLVRLKPVNLQAEKPLLQNAHTAERYFQDKVAEFRARCFKAFPDYEMVEIGVECAAVLVRLNELMASIMHDEVVHVVSDDPTAYVEMARWTDETHNSLVDWRSEGGLFHFIVRKARA